MVWHFCGKTNNNKLEKIQERALRIINKDYNSTYDNLLKISNTPTLLISRLRILLCEIFKCLKGSNPKCIRDMFEVKNLDYALRDWTRLYQPKKRTVTYGLRSISYTGTKLWNDMRPILTEETDIVDFKQFSLTLNAKSLDPLFEHYV